MSKQYIGKSPSISDKYSLFSKSGQRLYKRINNNIKIINKSRVSNTSNNSIGSVALRRTELSNDKIYSREEEFVPINTSQLNADLSSLYELPNIKSGNEESKFQSQKNYRQRLFKIRSQKQLGTYNSKSKQSRLFNNKKMDKRDIQRLIMLQTGAISNHSKNRQYQQKQRSNSKKSIDNDNSRGRQINIQKNQNSRYRPIKSIKSSLKSYLTFKRKNSEQLNDEVYLISNKERKLKETQGQRQNLKLLQNKYQNYYLKKNQQQNKYIQKKNRQKDKQDINQKDYKVFKASNHSNDKNKLLTKKQLQEKYIQNEQRQRQNNQKYKVNYKEYHKNDQYNRFNQNDSTYKEKKQNKDRLKTQYERERHKQKKIREQNQYQKYYKQSQKYNNNKNKKQQQEDTRNYKFVQKNERYKSKQAINSEPSLFIKSKINKQKNFLAKSKLRMNNLSQNQSQLQHQNRSNSKDHPKYSSNKQIYKKSNQYYDYPVKKQLKQMKNSSSKKQQLTQTFDSALLSINSRLNEKQYNINSQSFNTSEILQKIHIHLGTLKLIFDYCHQFKRMYQQTQNWDQLIFLSFKKYYVERVKIYNYLKSFKHHRKHQSQRVNQKIKRQSSQGLNIYSLNEIVSSNNFQNHFQILQKSQNPFTFPFCKVEDKQIKSIVKTPQYSIQISKIQTQNGSIYCQLQEFYNIAIAKGGNHINMLFCDNFSQEIFIFMLDQIDQLIPNLQELSLFEIAKIRLSKIVKCGILIAFINGSYIPNFTQIITYQDIDKNSKRKKIKSYTCYDLFYDVFQKIVGD